MVFVGPANPGFPLPLGHIRLNAFGQTVYLGRTVNAIAEVMGHLSEHIVSGKMRASGTPAHERRGADIVLEGWLEVLVSNSPAKKLDPSGEST